MSLTKKISTICLGSIISIVLICSTAFAIGATIERGDTNGDVEYLQTYLKDQGYYDYNEITGYFGIITEDALKGFQRDNNLKVDGVAGPVTWNIILEKSQETVEQVNESNKSTDNSDDKQTRDIDTTQLSYSNGMEGDEINKIQSRLQELGLYNYDRITGYYGSITKGAVRAFQIAHALEADGVVGENTWSILFSEFAEISIVDGMQGEQVRQLQQRLEELGYYAYTIDGLYGSKTKEAIKYFQAANNLIQDGIAGLMTQKVLFSTSVIFEKEARRDITSVQPTISNNTTYETVGTAFDIVTFSREYLGTPYVYATNGPDTFDCSGFTYFVFEHFGINIPRTSYNQGYDNYGIKIMDRDSLEVGDLVFFNTDGADGDLSDHTGVYIGNGEFIHSSSGSAKSVLISSMDDSGYYSVRFSWGRRVLQ